MVLARRARSVQDEIATVLSLFDEMGRRAAVPGSLDFTFGNPHEPPLPGLVAALREQVEPRSDTWFAYTTSQDAAREAVATSLVREVGLDFEPADIAMTQGAFGAIDLAFHLLTDPGDEVIVPVPGWFCYPPMLRAAAVTPVPADLAADTFDLDLDAIARAITPRTRVVVVNSPSNPTGRVLPRDQLQALADLLEAESARIGRRIWILSDEPYRRIRFAGVPFVSPAAVYPWTLIGYSYGKILLAPGQRLGYLALSPLLPRSEREQVRAAYDPVQLALGWDFPDAVMQYAVPALESVGLDLVELEAKRDRMHGELSAAGYRLNRPEGTFYLWGAAPRGDGDAFAAALAERGVLIMPGSLFDRPAHFRISLTATMASIEEALPAFVELA